MRITYERRVVGWLVFLSHLTDVLSTCPGYINAFLFYASYKILFEGTARWAASHVFLLRKVRIQIAGRFLWLMLQAPTRMHRHPHQVFTLLPIFSRWNIITMKLFLFLFFRKKEAKTLFGVIKISKKEFSPNNNIGKKPQIIAKMYSSFLPILFHALS